jgi:dTDP-4-amino-4,6-dideoxygalactose transaminase
MELNKFQNEVPILTEDTENIALFKPHIPKGAVEEIADTLNTRWIGQGPKVERFEKEFAEKFCNSDPGVAVGSGTDALHLAYLLAGIGLGDEVLTPVFTCTATNIPLLYIGAVPVFIDVEPGTLNINLQNIEKLITEKTKALVCVHYGGLPCDMDGIAKLASKYNLKVIEDAAHAVGAKYKGRSIGEISDFTMFSFQAIKHITTGDGGYLSFKDPNLLELAKRLRWFGIDRSKKQLGIWENDIKEIGFKYQMTDLGASLGLASLKEFDQTLAYRRALLNRYCQNLEEVSQVEILSKETYETYHAAWLFTIRTPRRWELQVHLAKSGIESNQVHYRNDRYSIFGSRRTNLPVMDAIEKEYLVLPLHTQLRLEDIDRVTDQIKLFFKSS